MPRVESPVSFRRGAATTGIASDAGSSFPCRVEKYTASNATTARIASTIQGQRLGIALTTGIGVVTSGAASSSSALTTSFAVAGRRAGSTSRQLVISAVSAGGISGRPAKLTESSGLPSRASRATRPKEKMSVR